MDEDLRHNLTQNSNKSGVVIQTFHLSEINTFAGKGK